MNFVCQGRSVSNSRKSSPKAGRFNQVRITSSSNLGVTRNGVRYRKPNHNHVPSVVSGCTRSGLRYRIPSKEFYRNRSTSPKGFKSPPRFLFQKETIDNINYKNGDKFTRKVKSKTELSAVGTKPRIYLESCPSGNNINFTCSIDKNFLRAQTSMAFHFDEDGNIVYGEKPKEYDLLSFQRPMDKIQGKLTSDNLQVYEKQSILSSQAKRHLLERWVDDVIHARGMLPSLAEASKSCMSLRSSNSKVKKRTIKSTTITTTIPTEDRSTVFGDRRSRKKKRGKSPRRRSSRHRSPRNKSSRNKSPRSSPRVVFESSTYRSPNMFRRTTKSAKAGSEKRGKKTSSSGCLSERRESSKTNIKFSNDGRYMTEKVHKRVVEPIKKNKGEKQTDKITKTIFDLNPSDGVCLNEQKLPTSYNADPKEPVVGNPNNCPSCPPADEADKNDEGCVVM